VPFFDSAIPFVMAAPLLVVAVVRFREPNPLIDERPP
jgi:hypothetical protein